MPDNDIFLHMAEAELDAGYNDWLETFCQCWADCCDDIRPRCVHGMECGGHCKPALKRESFRNNH